MKIIKKKYASYELKGDAELYKNGKKIIPLEIVTEYEGYKVRFSSLLDMGIKFDIELEEKDKSISKNELYSDFEEAKKNAKKIINERIKEKLKGEKIKVNGFLDSYHFSEHECTELTFAISEKINGFIIDCLNNDKRDFKITLKVKE